MMVEEIVDEQVYTWKIINPSDPYTIIGPERIVAFVVLFVGSGKLGISRDDWDGLSTILVFASKEQVDATIRAITGGVDWRDWMIAHADEIVAACESVLIGNDRGVFEKVIGCISDPAERRAAWDAYQDARRTSVNDIGGAIRGFGDQVAAMAAKAAASARDGEGGE